MPTLRAWSKPASILPLYTDRYFSLWLYWIFCGICKSKTIFEYFIKVVFLFFFYHQQEVSHMLCWYALITTKQHHFGCAYHASLKVSWRTNPKNTLGAAFLSTTCLQSRAGKKCYRPDCKEEFFKGLRNPMQIHWGEIEWRQRKKKKTQEPCKSLGHGKLWEWGKSWAVTVTAQVKGAGAWEIIRARISETQMTE